VAWLSVADGVTAVVVAGEDDDGSFEDAGVALDCATLGEYVVILRGVRSKRCCVRVQFEEDRARH
jgi:hypothetical protein